MSLFTYRGFTIGQTGQPGGRTAYRISNIDGLDGVQVRTDADRNQPRGDGQLRGHHYQDARRITITLKAVGDFDAVIPPLRRAFAPSRLNESPLTWMEGGEERRSNVSITALEVPRQATDGPKVHEVRIALKASDPRIYGRQRVVMLRPFEVIDPGFNYPTNYPKDYGEPDQLQAVANNAGDSDAHPSIRVRGPESGQLQRWELINTTNGSRLEVDTPIGPGQTLTVRMRELVAPRGDLMVELDGESRYSGWVTRPGPFWLSPGDNVLRFIVHEGELPSSADATYRDTYGASRR